MCLTRLVSVVLLSGLCLAALRPAEAAVFYPEHFVLANGLEIVIVKNNLSPAVAQMLWYKVGASDDPKGRSGLAHYLEHLMFRGTNKVPTGAFSASIAIKGGRDNAFTSHDATAYHEIVAADHLGFVMQLEADRMQSLQIQDSFALPEHKVVQSERQERTENSPEGLFVEKLDAALFPHHPYGVPIIGWQNELETLTPEIARQHYKTFYAPNNAVLIVSGNVETQEVLRLAAGTYGRVPKQEIPPVSYWGWPSIPSENRIEMSDKRVKLPRFHLSVLVDSDHSYKQKKPSKNPRPNPRAYEVLAEVLGGGEVGLLYKNLVRNKNIAAGIDVYYDATKRSVASFGISAIPASGVSDAVLEAAVLRELTSFSQQGLPVSEIKKAKKRLDESAVFARDSLMAPCQILGSAMTSGGSLQDVENWPDQMQKIQPHEVHQALRSILNSPHRVTAWLRPEQGAKKSTQEKGNK